jgi:transposase
VNRRFELTDAEWDRLKPFLPDTTPRRGGRWRDHRQVLNAILFRTRTGVPWRDLPDRYGPWQTSYKRFARWQADGTWNRIHTALQLDAEAAGDLDWDAQADTTIVRAHQHAAGARKRGTRPTTRSGGKPSDGRGVG